MGWWRDFTDRNLCFATFFSTKKMEKKTCPNIILISSKWSTECFKSDGRKTLQIEIFVLQHFFRKKTLETYVQISLQWFWNDPLNVLKAIVERCCSRWNFSISRWIEIFYFAFFFVSLIFFGLATVAPLWFPVVFLHCAYCREGPWGILRPETLEIFTLSAHARARVGVT